MGKEPGFGSQRAIWRAVTPQGWAVGAGWFLRRFLASSSAVVHRWGPAWARRCRLWGYEIGAWLLLVAWLGLPAILAARFFRSVPR